jgi:membrane-associated phospholipid phosphatase
MKNFFKTLPVNIVNSFKGHSLYFHFLAITLTVVILKSGLDWYYFLAVRDPLLNSIFFPALVIGLILPMLIPTVLIIKGYIKKQPEVSLLGWCLGQAALAGWIISSTYKAFTGRVQPNLLDLINDSSNSFQFGFWEHGIFWGWPSSHTTVAFAMAFALISFYPKHKILAFTAIVYALYIGIGVSFSVHWFSEFVSGLIIGTVIGLTVGKAYSQKLK